MFRFRVKHKLQMFLPDFLGIFKRKNINYYLFFLVCQFIILSLLLQDHIFDQRIILGATTKKEPALQTEEITLEKNPDKFFFQNESGSYTKPYIQTETSSGDVNIRTKSATKAGYQDLVIDGNNQILFDGEKKVAEAEIKIEKKENDAWQEISAQKEEQSAETQIQDTKNSGESPLQSFLNRIFFHAKADELEQKLIQHGKESILEKQADKITVESEATLETQEKLKTEVQVALNKTEGRIKQKQTFKFPKNGEQNRLIWEIQLKEFDLKEDKNLEISADSEEKGRQYGNVIIDCSDFSGQMLWQEDAQTDTVKIYFEQDGTTEEINIDPILSVTTPASQIVVSDGTRTWVFDESVVGAPKYFYHTSVGGGADNIASSQASSQIIGPGFYYNGTLSGESQTLMENTQTRVKIRTQGAYSSYPTNIDNYYTIYPNGQAFLSYTATTVGPTVNNRIGVQHYLNSNPQIQDADATNHSFVQSDTTNNNYVGMSVVPYTIDEFGGAGAYTYLNDSGGDRTMAYKNPPAGTYTGNMVVDFSNYRATTTTRDNLRLNYRNPATMTNFDKGSQAGDGFDEGEGAYTVTADASGDVKFDFIKGSYTRTKPAFKIASATRAEDSYVVAVSGAVKTKGIDYNLSKTDASTVVIQWLSDVTSDLVDIEITGPGGTPTGNKIWDGGGGDNNWSTDANWSDDTQPVAGDNVVFGATSTKASTIDAGFAGTINNLIIDSGYTGTITASRSLTITTDWSQVGGTFLAGSQTINVGGSWSRVGGTFTPGTSTVNMTATTTGKTITSSGQGFANLNFTGSGGGWTFNDNASVTGNLNLTAGVADLGIYDLALTGSANISNGEFKVGASANNGWTMTNLTIGDNGIVTSTGNAKYTLSGNWDATAATAKFTRGTSTITLTGSGYMNPGGYSGNKSWVYNLVIGQNGNTNYLNDIYSYGDVYIGTDGVTGGGFTGRLELYKASSNPLSLHGTPTSFGTIDYRSTAIGSTVIVPSSAYYNIIYFYSSGNGNTYLLSGNITANIITIYAWEGYRDILDTDPAHNYSITVNGNLTLGHSTTTTRTGAVQLNNSTLTVTGDVLVRSSTGANHNTILANNATINAGGSFTNNDTLSLGTSTVNMTATTTGKTITSSGQSFANLNFTGSGGGWTLQDALVATSLRVEAGSLVDNAKIVTVNGNIYVSTSASLTSTGTWTQGASGTLSNNAYVNRFRTLNISGEGVTSHFSGSVFVGNITIGSGTINGNNNLYIYPPSSDAITINNPTVGTPFNSIKIYNGLNQKEMTFPNNIAGSIEIYSITRMYTATGDWNFGNNEVRYKTDNSSYYINMNGYNLTCGNLISGYYAGGEGSGKIKLGSGTHTINGNIQRYSAGYTHYFEMESSTLNVAGSVDFTDFSVTPGTSTVNMTATTTGKTITSSGQSFANLNFTGVGGGWTLQDDLTASSLRAQAGNLIDNGKTVTVNGNIIIDNVSGLLTSTGTWIQGASGNIANKHWANTFKSLILAGSGVSSTLTDTVYVGSTSIDGSLILGPGILYGNNKILSLESSASDPLTINSLNSGSALSQFHYRSYSNTLTQKALSFPSSFGSIYLRPITGNITATGNFNFANNPIYISMDSASVPNKYVDMANYSLTAGNVYFGYGATFNGYLKLGTSVNHSIGNIARVGGTGSSHIIEFNSSTTAVSGNIDFTGINVTPGTSTVNMTGAGASITAGGNSLNNLTYNSAGGTLTLNGDLDIKGNYLVQDGSVNYGTNKVTLSGSATQSVRSNSSSFYNLDITNPAGVIFTDPLGVSATLKNNTAGSTLTFKESSLNTINTLDLLGTDGVENSVKLRSASPGVQYRLAYTTNTQMDYLDIQDADNTSAIIQVAHANDSGNNTNWYLQSVYETTSTSPQVSGIGWQENLTAKDYYNNTTTADSTTAVNLTASLPNVKFYTDDSYGTETTSYTLTDTASPIYIKVDTPDNESFTYTASDTYGKEIISGEISINNEAPVSSITAPSEGAVFGAGVLQISGVASDSLGGVVAGVDISINNGSFVAVQNTGTNFSTWSFSYEVRSSQEINIRSRATDSLGRVEVPGAGVNVKVDTETPSVSISYPEQNGWINQKSYTVKGIGYDFGSSPIVKVEFSTSENTAWRQATNTGTNFSSWQYAWESYDDIKNIDVYARAIDGVGNVSQTFVTKAGIDTVAPSKPLYVKINNVSDYMSERYQIFLNWQRSIDKTSGVAKYEIYRDGNKVGETTDDWYIDQNLSEREFDYYIVAVDKAGNGANSNINNINLTKQVNEELLIENESFEQLKYIQNNKVSVLIKWKTNRFASSNVAYVANGEKTSKLITDNNLNINHAILLADLNPDTEYNYQIYSKDSSGISAEKNNLVFRTDKIEIKQNIFQKIFIFILKPFKWIGNLFNRGKIAGNTTFFPLFNFEENKTPNILIFNTSNYEQKKYSSLIIVSDFVRPMEIERAENNNDFQYLKKVNTSYYFDNNLEKGKKYSYRIKGLETVVSIDLLDTNLPPFISNINIKEIGRKDKEVGYLISCQTDQLTKVKIDGIIDSKMISGDNFSNNHSFIINTDSSKEYRYKIIATNEDGVISTSQEQAIISSDNTSLSIWQKIINFFINK